MSGRLQSFARKGSKAERVADLLLSSIGVCTPVRREDDYGVDFHCQLGQVQEEGYVTYHSRFILQAKSNIDGGILYGAKDPQKWKQESVEWLFQNKISLFIGVVDLNAIALSIYDTTGLWQVFNKVGAWSSQILMLPDRHGDEPMRKNVESVPLENWVAGKGDGFRHIIDLGKPVARIAYSELGKWERLSNYLAHFTNVIYYEQKNIVNRDLQMRVFWEVKGGGTNHSFIQGILFEPHPSLQPERVVEELYPGLISLLIKLRADGRDAEWKPLKEFLRDRKSVV